MEKVLKLYTFVEGGSAIPFPNDNEQIEVSSFRYDAKRMATAPTISCTIEHTACLDNLWTKNVYVIFRGEKYYLKQIPTSSYSNSGVLYKHDVEFVSERSILDNVYLYDVVDEDETVDRVVSNSTSFSFSGNIHEFVTRLNKSLTRLNVGYSIVIDDGISSEVKLVSFDNKFITEALQEISNTYNLKYYFIGKVIHVGLQQNIISKVFKYGDNESLLSISKNNANAKIINRITGVGSSDNIPFYYPNDDEKGVTEVLLNGSPNGATIVDTVKYRRVKSTDTFIFKGNAEYSVDLIGDAKRVLGNVSFIGDPEAQKSGYEVDFYYQIELETAENVRISVTSSHNETRNLSYELVKTNGVNYGINTSEKIFSLSRGTYNIIVRWRYLVDKPFMYEEKAFDLIDEYVKVNAEIVVASNNIWTLNNIPINLESYGISSESPKDGDRITVNRLLYIHPQKNLMPSIYRIEEGRERFYNAENDKYKDENGKYYKFENIYSSRHPHEHIENFDDIKPTIKNVKNNQGEYIDSFIDFAYDTNDNDEVDENNEFIHPYFYAKLRKFDGEFGFNLFDHAIESNEMTISMVSGSCASCEFTIMVDPDTQKNTVLVDDNGNIIRDDNGNIRRGTPLDRQNDTINNEVWIALKKDINTYGVIMPNATNKYRPSANDKFVILHIDLPKVYITQAEKKLEEELIKYMYDNNSEKFTFSISFSRIFFAENPSILNDLNENSKITIEYNGKEYELYVSNFSYSLDSSNSLPEVKVELSDVITISQNQISKIVTATTKEILAKTEQNKTTTAEISKLSTSLEAEIQNIKDELYKPRQDNKFLRNDRDDRSTGLISSDKGFEVGKDQGIFKDDITSIVTAIVDRLKNVYHIESPDFQMGELGNGYVLKYEDGKSYFEVDEMLVRRIAYFIELIIKQLQYVGGEIALTPASMKCTRVEEYEEYYRCYFEKERDGQSIKQEFRVGDQARAQSFNIEEGVNENVSNQYYWRLVVRAESDENFIDLSKIDCDKGSLPPRVGDEIVQLGNRNDASRQNAIILSTIGDDAPSIKQYEGINSYSLEGKDVTVISPKGNKLKGDFLSKTGQDLVGRLDDLGASLDDVINQTDKVYTIWFENYNPSESNYPTNEWIDQAAKEEHVEDIFYNQEAGMAWRYQEVSEGVYAWVVITDHETIKALENAAKAQATADKKMQNFIAQPVPPYSVGDRWSNAVYGTQYDNDELVCINAKAAGESFSINDWQIVSSMSSADKKHFYSEFERTDSSIQSLVADGKAKDEAIAAANAAAKAASNAASVAIQTSNAANETANTTASALTQTNKSISSIVVAFERNADGSLKLDANGSPKITSAAGSVITNEMAGIYATKTTVDGINGRLGTAESNISATSKNLTALSQKITFDSSGNITNINKSGLVAESNFASLFSTQVTSQGVAKTSQLTAYVLETELGDLVSKIAISADQIDLTGKVTFDDFNQSVKNTINGKATTGDIDSKITAYDKTLGSLAKLNAVEKAQLGSTIISGGYIKGELLNVTEIHATSGSIAGFKISDNNLTNEGFSSDAAVIFKNNNNIAAIGSNVIPIESGANGAAYFQCHTEDSSRITKNYGMVVSAAGTGENVAIGIDGGCIEGFAMKNRIISGSGTIALSRVDYNIIVTSSSDCVLELPAMRLCDDGHVVRIKRLGSGGVTFKAKQCETFTSGTTGRNYPGIIYGSGKHVGSGNVAKEDKMSQYDSCEFVWVRDLRITIGGTLYNGAWIQYKMPRAW